MVKTPLGCRLDHLAVLLSQIINNRNSSLLAHLQAIPSSGPDRQKLFPLQTPLDPRRQQRTGPRPAKSPAMVNLVAVDVSVTDDRIHLVFSHRAVAQAYAKHLQLTDRRSQDAIPGYRRDVHLNVLTNEVTLVLPSFISWFITCRQPDDEDSTTFTFSDTDASYAQRWADSMVLFEAVARAVHDDDSLQQLHVRRLWNKSALLRQLEDLHRRASPKARGPTPGLPLRAPVAMAAKQGPPAWW